MAVAENNLWKQALKDNLVRLCSDLNFDDISSHVIANGILTPEQCQTIKKASCSRRCQTERFLDYLDRKTEKDFNKFLVCLARHQSYLTDHMKKVYREVLQGENQVPAQPVWRTVLQRCRVILVDNLDMSDIKNELRQNCVLSGEQEERIMKEPDPSTQSERMRLFLSYLTNREEMDFKRFLDCIGPMYNFVVLMIKKELNDLEIENDPQKKPFWKEAINNLMDKLTFHLDIRDICNNLIAKRVIDHDKLEECTTSGKRTRKVKTIEFFDVLLTRTDRDFRLFLKILKETNYGHIGVLLQKAVDELERRREAQERENWMCDDVKPFPAQEIGDRGAFGYQGTTASDGLAPRRRSPTENTIGTIDQLSYTLDNIRLVESSEDIIDSRPVNRSPSIEEIRRARRERVVAAPQPGTGFTVIFRLPSFIKVEHRFRFDNSVQNLVDFIGSHEDATEHFLLHAHGGFEVRTKTDDNAALCRSLQQCGITDHTLISVNWEQDGEKEVYVTSPVSDDG